MKTSELRIGNYVCRLFSDPAEYFVTNKDPDTQQDLDKVFSLNAKEVELFNDGNYRSPSYFQWYNPDKLQGIPITKEWMERFGAEKSNGDVYIINIGNTCWIEFYVEKAILTTISCDLWEEFKYVHELQNLYFTLTGNELT